MRNRQRWVGDREVNQGTIVVLKREESWPETAIIDGREIRQRSWPSVMVLKRWGGGGGNNVLILF